MYRIQRNLININGKTVRFAYPIRAVEKIGGRYIVLTAVPYEDKTTINNLYCLNGNGELLWQSEDLNTVYPEYKDSNMPYENLTITENGIFVSDFMGCCYHIDPDNGKITGLHYGR